jgi:hypothetical protein
VDRRHQGQDERDVAEREQQVPGAAVVRGQAAGAAQVDEPDRQQRQNDQRVQ